MAFQIPEGLYVYSQPYIAVGFPEGMATPNQRNKNAHAKTGLQPHQEEMRLKPDLPHCNLNRQLKQTAIEKQIPEGLHVYRISNPAGLHVYRKRKNVLNATPAGWNAVEIPIPREVEQLSVIPFLYKHLIPLESGRPKPENQSLEPATWNLQPVTLKEAA